MKFSRSTVIRALCTILIGALLIVFPTEADRWLVMGIGALFLVPGLVSIVLYVLHRNANKEIIKEAASSNGDISSSDMQQASSDIDTPNSNPPAEASNCNKPKRKAKPFFPIIGIGSILFGGILLFYPDSFKLALLFILGAFLVLAGIAQIYRFLQFRKLYHLGATPYILSTIISLAGLAIIIIKIYADNEPKPINGGSMPIEATLPAYIFGVAGILYGLSEIIYAIQFRHSEKKVIKSQQANINTSPYTNDNDITPKTIEPYNSTPQSPSSAPTIENQKIVEAEVEGEA